MKQLLVSLVFIFSVGKVLAASGDTWNFRFSPLGVIIGMVNGELDYKVTDNVVVGPSFAWWNLTIDDYTFKASGFGVQGSYYFNSAYNDGFYLGGALATASASVKKEYDDGSEISGSASGTGVMLKGGYHWFWDSFNLNLGLTLGSTTVGKVKLRDAAGNDIDESPSTSSRGGIDFAIGFTF